MDPTTKRFLHGVTVDGIQEYEIKQLDIDDIEPNPLNAQIYDPNDQQIADLRDSIREIGLEQPLVVRRTGVRSYTILSGHNRFAAISMLHDEDPDVFCKVPCRVKNDITTPAREKIEIVLQNIQRVKTPADISREIRTLQTALEEMVASGEIPPESVTTYISSLTNMSYSSVSRYSRIEENLTDELADRFHAGEMSVNTADKLAGMSEEEQQELADRFAEDEKITTSMVEKAVSRKKGKAPTLSVTFTVDELQTLIGPEPVNKKQLRDIIIKALGKWRQDEALL